MLELDDQIEESNGTEKGDNGQLPRTVCRQGSIFGHLDSASDGSRPNAGVFPPALFEIRYDSAADVD
jgi:hypothetical protein